MDEKFLGHIVAYDPVKQTISVKLDFLSLDHMAVIEEMSREPKAFAFCFKKPFRRSKTWEQLKKYHALLKNILLKNEILVKAENMKTLDDCIKRAALPCDWIECDGVRIPVIPSKTDMSKEQMNYLISWVLQNYSYLKLEEHEI